MVAAFAGAGVGVVYAVDAALPDKHRHRSIDVKALNRVVLTPPTGTVDYAEFGYPTYTTAGTPELRYERSLVVPSVEVAHLPESFQPRRSVRRTNRSRGSGSSLPARCARSMATAGMFLWRRRGRLNVAA